MKSEYQRVAFPLAFWCQIGSATQRVGIVSRHLDILLPRSLVFETSLKFNFDGLPFFSSLTEVRIK